MRLLRKLGILALTVLVFAFGLVELVHLVRFGHLLPFGLHSDVVSRHVDFGIDGITKAYEARLTNYGITPANITSCDFVDDAMSHGTIVGSTVERWNPLSKKWESVFNEEKSSFCHPYPLGMIEAHILTKRLWPGQSISTGEEATAAIDVFVIGDRARFLVFAGEGLTLPTAAFSIDEHPTSSSVPYRVRH